MILSTLALGCVSRAEAEAECGSGVFHGQVTRVLSSPGAWKKTAGLLLREIHRRAEPPVLLENPAFIRAIEDAHHRLFDDLPAKNVEAASIRVDLKGLETAERVVWGQEVRVVTRVESLDPCPRAGSTFVKAVKLDPPDPVEDAHHRYLEVPICHARPDWGTFKLYYEVNSDFDRSKPTIMLPGSGQVEESWAGFADRYKNEVLETDCNVVVFQYRGTFASRIDRVAIHRKLDWSEAYQIFRIENVVEDMDRVRRDLLGTDGKLHLWGCSAVAVVAAAYLAKYSRHVPRAFLSGFFKDTAAACRSAVQFFERFLAERKLTASFDKIVREGRLPVEQLLFVLQRLLYSDQQRAEALIREAASGNAKLLDEETARQGTVDAFIRTCQLNAPQGVVFMYETNIPVYEDGRPDINAVFYKIGEPIRRFVPAGERNPKPLDLENLESVCSEVLLLAGTLDQVAPVEEMEKLRRLLPRSRLAIFQAYHCFYDQKTIRNRISELFYRGGLESAELGSFLRSGTCKSTFVELR